ncbi:TspO/MBR family protein [uncultured Jannaschia sp.]|uniref:tryptophan-rich sensory protein TspO n=1 Tax=uncultured Jannaschia sp. TaxID=293347 RepID=UPI00261CA42A|nr:TspO/MBR family protein [uncultured Jannaschia sp.]
MDWTLFPVFLGACGAAAATGVLFRPGAWYAGLAKPVWTPPDRLFPVAWTILYVLLAFAAARVAGREGAALPMALWSLQIALNTLWTPVFFGLHRMRAALVVILCLLLAAVALAASLSRIDTLACYAVVPYVAWLIYAAALNASVLRRNPQPG